MQNSYDETLYKQFRKKLNLFVQFSSMNILTNRKSEIVKYNSTIINILKFIEDFCKGKDTIVDKFYHKKFEKINDEIKREEVKKEFYSYVKHYVGSAIFDYGPSIDYFMYIKKLEKYVKTFNKTLDKTNDFKSFSNIDKKFFQDIEYQLDTNSIFTGHYETRKL